MPSSSRFRNPSLVILICGFQQKGSTNANVHFFPDMAALIQFALTCSASEVRIMISENHVPELRKSTLMNDKRIRSIEVFGDKADLFLKLRDLKADHLRISSHRIEHFEVSLEAASGIAGINNDPDESYVANAARNAALMQQMIEHSDSANNLRQNPNEPITAGSTRPQVTTISRTSSDSNAQEKRLRRDTIETTIVGNNLLAEVETLKALRRRTFSHWTHRSSPSSSQMIQAGFFNCNVGDRVICIYCNLICQGWIPETDDPCEVHKTLSPKCSYVIAMLTQPQISSTLVINEPSSSDQSSSSASTDPVRFNTIVYTAACNPNYIEPPKRYASFATWSNDNSPSVDDLVKAGFFFTGTKTIVTCFYCNGSLQNWGSNDNPTVEHARWFPHCAYAKQLCGAEQYRKIQEAKRAQQERTRNNDASNRSGLSPDNVNNGGLVISDESTLSRLVAARLDLPISQSLLDRNFKLSIIKRCWEDQLRLKHDDFLTDSDLFMACLILQKQIERIDGKTENFIVPSIAMRGIHHKKQAEGFAASSFTGMDSLNTSAIETTTSTSSVNDTTPRKLVLVDADERKQEKTNCPKTSVQSVEIETLSIQNPCGLCWQEEKCLACLPCGHLIACVPCGHSFRSCPICGREIKAFVRIYI